MSSEVEDCRTCSLPRIQGLAKEAFAVVRNPRCFGHFSVPAATCACKSSQFAKTPLTIVNAIVTHPPPRLGLDLAASTYDSPHVRCALDLRVVPLLVTLVLAFCLLPLPALADRSRDRRGVP